MVRNAEKEINSNSIKQLSKSLSTSEALTFLQFFQDIKEAAKQIPKVEYSVEDENGNIQGKKNQEESEEDQLSEIGITIPDDEYTVDAIGNEQGYFQLPVEFLAKCLTQERIYTFHLMLY